jgi:threonine dehydrogenase-like Zn-dependent dehydrogenase
MKALRIANGRLSLAETAKPAHETEAVVRVLLSGICNTDLEIVRGYAGFDGTIGHEFVGVVESAPGVPELVGQRVVGEINAGCGACLRCLAGDARHCSTRTVLGIVGRDGAHADFLQLPTRNLLRVPDRVTDVSAVFTEPLAAACAIVERVKIGPADRVAVVGDGKLGLLCALVLHTHGARVTLIGKHAEKLGIAGARGIETVMITDADALARKFQFAVEASGSESGFALALDLLEPRGTLVLKSTFHGEPKWQAARVVVDEITVVGSRCGRFADALNLLDQHAFNVDALVSDEFRLEDGLSAMARAAEAGVLKVLLRP